MTSEGPYPPGWQPPPGWQAPAEGGETRDLPQGQQPQSPQPAQPPAQQPQGGGWYQPGAPAGPGGQAGFPPGPTYGQPGVYGAPAQPAGTGRAQVPMPGSPVAPTSAPPTSAPPGFPPPTSAPPMPAPSAWSPAGSATYPPGAPGVYGAPPGEGVPGAPPGAPPPARSRRGLFIGLGIGALAVVILAAIGITLLLSSGNQSYPVGSCVKQSGDKAEKVSCSSSGAYTIVSKVDKQSACPDANQPFVVLHRTGTPNQVLCLKPAH